MAEGTVSWNIEELNDLVIKKHGLKYAHRLQVFLNSTSKKIRIAAYHSSESRNMMNGFFPHGTEVENYSRGFDLLFGHMTANINETEKQESIIFHNTLWKAEAHVIACAHAIHSLIDIMAQVINLALSLKINENDVSWHKIKNAIENKHSRLHDLVLGLKNDERYKYLQAFVNSQKHIFFIPATFTLEAEVKEGQRAYGLKIPAFTFKNQPYPEKWSEDFVTSDYVILKDKMIYMGIELNQVLRAEA